MVDSDRLLALGEKILQTFDFQLSKENRRTEILPGASEKLDSLRAKYTQIYDALPRVKETVARRAPAWASKYIQDCVMFPGEGYLTVVTLDKETGEGVYRGNDPVNDPWEMVFVRGSVVHYKNQLMRQIDKEWGDPAAEVASKCGSEAR